MSDFAIFVNYGLAPCGHIAFIQRRMNVDGQYVISAGLPGHGSISCKKAHTCIVLKNDILKNEGLEKAKPFMRSTLVFFCFVLFVFFFFFCFVLFCFFFSRRHFDIFFTFSPENRS